MKTWFGQSSIDSAGMAKQGAETHARDAQTWAWVEVWSWWTCMLSALVTALKVNFAAISWSPVTRSVACETASMKKPPTGEPYAGKPPVRFGGRGRRKPIPTPIEKGGVFSECGIKSNPLQSKIFIPMRITCVNAVAHKGGRRERR